MPAVTSSFMGEHDLPFARPSLSLLDVAISVGMSVGEGVGIEEDAVWDCETGMLKAGGSLPVRRKDSSVSASRPNQGSSEESWILSVESIWLVGVLAVQKTLERLVIKR